MFPSASVLAVPNLEEAVRLLRQLRRKRREDERLKAEAVGDVQHLLDEEVGTADDRSERNDGLNDDGRHPRRIAARGVEISGLSACSDSTGTLCRNVQTT